MKSRIAGLITLLFTAILMLICLNNSTSALPPPQDEAKIKLEEIVNGLQAPVYLTHSRDQSKRLFIIEQPGRIRIFKNGALLPTPFLNIESLISYGGERGLLGLAFHPKYAVNRRFFVDYTRLSDGATVIAEYQASTTNADIAATSGRILLIIPQPFANHNGGQLEFGSDGFLYIGMGDGGSGGDPLGNGQNRDSLLGKILRIDVDGQQPYQIPTDNPFVNRPGADEIYAVGMRNPFRFSFDRKTGELYVGDVGQNRLEEIDIVVKGGNYGWNIMEASQCFNPMSNCNRSGLTLPVAEYDHNIGCSVTGGYVYRGQRFPKLAGIYFYGDFCTGVVFGLQNGRANKLLDSGQSISSFGEDEDGEIYLIDYQGAISRIVDASVQQTSCSLICGGAVTMVDSDNDGFEIVSFPPPIANGDCGVASCIPTGGAFPLGTTLVTCSSTSNGGFCSFTVTVLPAPCQLTCPADITVTDSDNNGSEKVTFPAATSNGNCGAVTSSASSGGIFPVGTTVVNYQSAAGNSSCSFNVIVKPFSDTTLPTIKVLSPNGGEKAHAGKTLSINWQSADNSGIASHDVQLSLDGGNSYQTIAGGLAGTAQSFQYQLPRKQAAKTARVRVIVTDLVGNKAQDDSDGSFRIKKK